MTPTTPIRSRKKSKDGFIGGFGNFMNSHVIRIPNQGVLFVGCLSRNTSNNDKKNRKSDVYNLFHDFELYKQQGNNHTNDTLKIIKMDVIRKLTYFLTKLNQHTIR